MSLLKKLAAALVVVAAAFASQPAFATTQRILISDETVQMQLGDLTSVTLTLDQPIVCLDQSLVCDVVVDFGSTFPQGVEVSPTSVTWAANEWFQPRTINLSVDSNAESLIGQTFTLGATVATNSNYYTGLTPSITLSVPADSTPPIAYDTRTLAATGFNDYLLITVGLTLVAAGTTIIRVRNRGVRK